MGGQLVQFMEVSFQEAGIYSSREMAIYSDGRSQTGEQISSRGLLLQPGSGWREAH